MLQLERIGIKRWRTAAGASMVAAALLLSACGGNDHDNRDMNAPPVATQPPPPTTGVDVFIDYVKSIVAAMSETAEPVSIDNVPVTVPENTEPVPVT
jgi:hypothetical protein